VGDDARRERRTNAPVDGGRDRVNAIIKHKIKELVFNRGDGLGVDRGRRR